MTDEKPKLKPCPRPTDGTVGAVWVSLENSEWGRAQPITGVYANPADVPGVMCGPFLVHGAPRPSESAPLREIAAGLRRFAGDSDWEYPDGTPADLRGWADAIDRARPSESVMEVVREMRVAIKALVHDSVVDRLLEYLDRLEHTQESGECSVCGDECNRPGLQIALGELQEVNAEYRTTIAQQQVDVANAEARVRELEAIVDRESDAIAEMDAARAEVERLREGIRATIKDECPDHGTEEALRALLSPPQDGEAGGLPPCPKCGGHATNTVDDLHWCECHAENRSREGWIRYVAKNTVCRACGEFPVDSISSIRKVYHRAKSGRAPCEGNHYTLAEWIARNKQEEVKDEKQDSTTRAAVVGTAGGGAGDGDILDNEPVTTGALERAREAAGLWMGASGPDWRVIGQNRKMLVALLDWAESVEQRLDAPCGADEDSK